MSLLEAQKKGNSKNTLPRHHGTHMGLQNTIRADLKDKLVERLKSMDGSQKRSRVSDTDTDTIELSMCTDGSSVGEERSHVKRRRKGLFLFRAIRTRKSGFGLGATRIDTGICTSPRTALVFPASVDAEQNNDDAAQQNDDDSAQQNDDDDAEQNDDDAAQQNDDDAAQQNDDGAAQQNVVMVDPVHNADTSIDGFIDDEFLDAL